MPKGQFYALAIFVMGRLGWKVIISLGNLNNFINFKTRTTNHSDGIAFNIH